jgi:hypothetical protein
MFSDRRASSTTSPSAFILLSNRRVSTLNEYGDIKELKTCPRRSPKARRHCEPLAFSVVVIAFKKGLLLTVSVSTTAGQNE